jgi:hypothetical protein
LGNITNIASGNSSLTLQTGSSPTTAVTVDTSQNVGIGGTPTSGFKLDVATGAIRSSVTSGGSGFEAGWSTASSYTFLQSYNRGTSAPADLAIWGTNTRFLYGSGGTEGMRINSSGNVGIGTTSPTQGKVAIKQSASTIDSGLAIQAQSNDSYFSFWNDGSVFNISAHYNSTGSYQPIAFRTSNSERMRINSDGSVMIGTTTNFGNGGFLDVDSTAAVVNGVNVKCNNVNYAYIAYTGTNFMYFTTSGTGPVGTITYNGSITVYGTTSDQRLKENIVDAPSAFDFINSLKIRSFDWKESGKHHKFGVIAQELVEISPESVSVPQKEEDIWQVDTSALVPSLVKAIQELKAINDTQAATINALTARIETLERK